MVLEDPGQPVGDIGSRRTTRVEDAPQLRTSGAYGPHPGLQPRLEHAPIGHGRLSTLLGSVEVPTTRCASTGNAAPLSEGTTFDELVASLRQIDGQRDKGKHPPNFHFRSIPFLHFHNGPDRTYADVRFGGDFEPVTAYPARRTLICVAGGPASSGVLGACVEQSDDPEEPVEALAMAGGLPKFTATVCTCRWCFTDRRPTKSSTAGLLAIAQRLEFDVVATNTVRFAAPEESPRGPQASPLAGYFLVLATARRWPAAALTRNCTPAAGPPQSHSGVPAGG
jgi:hypothetical protein